MPNLTQLTKETLSPQPVAPGQPRRINYEYERNGTAKFFLWFEPLAGQRHVKVTDGRTTRDFAEAVRNLVASYPTAERIVLVVDKLNPARLRHYLAVTGTPTAESAGVRL